MNDREHNKGKNTKETLAWMNETYDTEENVIKQMMDDGHGFVFYFGDLRVQYDIYDDFLIYWDDMIQVFHAGNVVVSCLSCVVRII